MSFNYDLNPPHKTELDEKTTSLETCMMKTTVIRLLFFLQGEESRKKLNDCLISNDGFLFCITSDLPNCLIAASNDKYDVLITDFCDFDLDFGETVTKIKEASNSLAIMLLTRQSDHLKEIDFLNSGVESVMNAPFKASLMIARIQAILRWKDLSAYNASQIGPFKFDIESKRLCSNQIGDVRVTDKEARILQFLLSRKGGTVSRTDLLQHVWGYNSASNTHTVETHIYRLRKKIGRIADSKSIIITEAGGYRLAK